MRNFIVSDLHGDGNIYDSIIAYLENIKNMTNDDITLYINGDLIDRGSESARMLIDVKNRIENNIGFKIEYLGGNHELMMWQAAKKRKDDWPIFCNWFRNGGDVTADGLDELLSLKELDDVIRFISSLKIYHKFKETLNGKNIVLVHARCPKYIFDNCNLEISDNHDIETFVWSRKNDYGSIPKQIGNKKYFTIIGHSPLTHPYGYIYYKDQNYINIDGGCSGYVIGMDGYDHVPLVEIDSNNDRLIILTFNNNNEIVYGNYFSNGISTTIEDLSEYRKYIDKNVKLKKLVKQDGKTFFK